MNPSKINTLIGSAIFIGVCWLVKTTNSTDKSLGLVEQAIANQERARLIIERDILELRGRMLAAEIELAKLGARP